MLKNKFTIITGGAGFLGRSHCISVLELKKNVIIIDNNKSALDKVANFLKKKFPNNKILSFCINITDELEVAKLSKYLSLKKKIKINSIINNAAIDAVPKKNNKNNEFVSTEQWNKEIGVSIIGSYLIIKHFIFFLKKNNNASVINIGSDLSVIAPNQKLYKKIYKNYFKPVTYSVIKHALWGMTKYYASFYADQNIRFNMVSPGPILRKQKKQLISELKNIIPMNRLGDKNDIKGIIKFLLSKESNYITGQNILVDGGRTII